MKKRTFNIIAAIALLMLNVNDTVAQTTTVGKGDLPAFELKGNVKSCKWTDIYGFEKTCTFNAKGQWIGEDENELTFRYQSIKRDSAGRIIYLVDGFVAGDCEGVGEERIFDTSGRLTKVKYYDFCDDSSYVRTYVYNTKGFLAKKDTWTYTYLATDAKGNWTKRKVVDSDDNKTYTETRVITYY